MCSNRFLNFLLIITLALFGATASGHAGSSGERGDGGMGVSGIGGGGGRSINLDDMTTLGKGVGLSYSGGIKPIDRDLDMTKIGRLDSEALSGNNRRNDRSSVDSLDHDIKDFDARLGLRPPVGDQSVAGPQPPDRIGRRGTRNAGIDRQLTVKQQEAAVAGQQAASQEDVSQVLATIGASTPATSATTTFTPGSTPNSSQPPVTVSPPESSVTSELTPSATTDQTPAGQIEDTSAPLSAGDLSSLRSLFFPAGAPPSALTSSQPAIGVGLDVGSTLSDDIALNPLPDVALNSAEAANLGYFFDGQSIVIADFKTRSVVGVLSNAS